MSGPAAIRVEGLGKRYRLRGPRPRYATLRESLMQALTRPFRGGSGTRAPFWALREVSFEVAPGEVLGLIGANGAGKSTLLKVLGRITAPSAGRAVVRGRVGTLLEVGTGFHPELSGRENVFLSGAILGMSRAEVAGKLDAIVSFAGVEAFVDTPVKHYSSGMHVRLGFAVAAHLDVDILLVDEVLAVGDAAFQARCLERMSGVAREGRTVLFVSHNMAAIRSLCQRALVLADGRVRFDGEPGEAIARYLSRDEAPGEDLSTLDERGGAGPLRFSRILLRDARGQSGDTFPAGAELQVELSYGGDARPPEHGPLVLFVIVRDALGQRLVDCCTRWCGQRPQTIPEAGTLRCVIPKLPLLPGRYTLDLVLKADALYDHVPGAASFTVTAGDFYGTGKLPVRGSGPLLVEHAWRWVEE